MAEDFTIVDRQVRRPWVDIKQLSELTRVPIGTLRKYNQLPDAPVIRFGGKCRFDADEYRDWLKADGPAKSRRKLMDDLHAKH